MGLRTRLCRLLHIDYPILQAGMPWVSNAELAAAVSEAGGLGVVAPTAGLRRGGDLVANLAAQVRKAQALTQRPIGVTVFLGLPQAQDLLKVAVEEGVRVVITGGPSPALFTGFLKDEGVTVLHIVASVHHARAAEAAGVDGVIAQGMEAGGFVGVDEVPALALIPQVVDAVEVPVVASGGIADGRGLVAALALGAEGVYVGTRFVATTECIAHPRYKEAIASAIDTGTLLLGRGNLPVRTLKLGGAVKQGTPLLERGRESWERFLLGDEVRSAVLEGDLEGGLAIAGAGVGLISEVLPAREVVARMVQQAETVLRDLL